jgi:hypothetical protein
MKILLLLVMLSYGNIPPVITGFRDKPEQVVWLHDGSDPTLATWPTIKRDGKQYFMQMRQSKTHRGTETNIFYKEIKQ